MFDFNKDGDLDSIEMATAYGRSTNYSPMAMLRTGAALLVI